MSSPSYVICCKLSCETMKCSHVWSACYIPVTLQGPGNEILNKRGVRGSIAALPELNFIGELDKMKQFAFMVSY